MDRPIARAALRIIHVLTHANVTRGGAIQALLLGRGQREQGHAVEVVVNSNPHQQLHSSFTPWLAAGLTIHPFRMEGHKPEFIRFRRFLAARRPDVLHVHRDTALKFAFFATPFATPRAFISQRGTTHPFRTRTTAFCHRSKRVHRIIAVAEAVKEALVCYGVAAERIEVVYGSFDVERFDPGRTDRAKLRTELGLAAAQKLVVQVGELHRKKAPTDFVEMAARVLARRTDVTFAMVGKGSQADACRQLIGRLGVGEKVLMLGFRSDIPDVYAAADVAVNTSSGFEGLTGAIREALAMARPVAATRVDGNPEVVVHGETGLLVPPRDPEAMAAAVTRLLDEPQLGRTLGAAGRALVLARMHPEVRLARTEAVYRAVLAGRGARAAAPL